MRFLAFLIPSLCALALGTSLFGASAQCTPKSPPKWFWGCWVVKKDLEVKDISALSQKQVDAIIGTRIVFTPSCARWKRVVIRSPKYTVRVLSNDQFFRGTYGTYNNLDEIGVRGNYVTHVGTDLPAGLSDLDFVGEDVYLRKHDIVIVVEGDYMIAEKAKPGDPACACRPGKTKRSHGRETHN